MKRVKKRSIARPSSGKTRKLLFLLGGVLMTTLFVMHIAPFIWRQAGSLGKQSIPQQQLLIHPPGGSTPNTIYLVEHQSDQSDYYALAVEQASAIVQAAYLDLANDQLDTHQTLQHLRFLLGFELGESLVMPQLISADQPTTSPDVIAAIKEAELITLTSSQRAAVTPPFTVPLELQPHCSVAVSNGTSISGLARSITAALERHSARVIAISDATKGQKTQVLLTNQALADCEVVLKLIAGLMPVLVDPQVDQERVKQARADIVLILGVEYSEVLEPTDISNER